MNRILTIVLLVAFSWVGMAQSTDYKTRSDVPVDYTWNFNDLYTNWEAWQADFKKIEATIPTIAAFKGN